MTAAPGRRRRTADVRAALVDAAVTVIERDGFPGLTVRAVAAEAGVAPMGVYNHLEGKDGLLVAVLARGFDRLREAIAWRPGLPPAAAFRASGHAYREFALGSPVTYGLMFGGGLVAAAVHDKLADDADPAFEALLTMVRAGQQAGIIRAGDVQLHAMGIWSAVHGAVALELANGVSREEGDAVYEAVLDLVVRGLAPERAAHPDHLDDSGHPGGGDLEPRERAR